ncbi:hypothetical protein TNCV_3188151 [Trichonephila clavipes]|nr:hypothetical protein TNCV_3188151 [Trichonephila clavipes]
MNHVILNHGQVTWTIPELAVLAGCCGTIRNSINQMAALAKFSRVTITKKKTESQHQACDHHKLLNAAWREL